MQVMNFDLAKVKMFKYIKDLARNQTLAHLLVISHHFHRLVFKTIIGLLPFYNSFLLPLNYQIKIITLQLAVKLKFMKFVCFTRIALMAVSEMHIKNSQKAVPSPNTFKTFTVLNQHF